MHKCMTLPRMTHRSLVHTQYQQTSSTSTHQTLRQTTPHGSTTSAKNADYAFHKLGAEKHEVKSTHINELEENSYSWTTSSLAEAGKPTSTT